MPGIWETMEEESVQTSGFYKPEVGKINKIRVLTDPIRGMTAFKTGEQRVQYQFAVNTVENPKVATVWGISAKGALQQIVAIVKANKLSSMVGATLQVMVTGEGMTRQYVILPIELPNPTNQAQVLIDFPREKLSKDFPKLFPPAIPVA